VAIVLGSGLGEFANRLGDAVAIDYSDLPHWPASKVIGHDGRLVVGTLAGKRVAALSGRAHFYEGHDMRTVTFATRVIGRLGVKALILTNAAGGVNDVDLTPGMLMVIDDHLNLLGTNPLVGPNDEGFGPRFPDMTEVYSKRLRAIADAVARDQGLRVGHGVYAAVHGPSYETPAEIRYLRTIGADAVGMSTVPEAIVARHMGVEVLGISCITNAAAGVLPQPLNHDEVMDVARRVRGAFGALLEGIVGRL
jgi:purine-nucleoside phosphorylase